MLLLEYSKNSSTSIQLRERSNKYYEQKYFQRAIRGYNLAILFAPIGTTELGLAYANRSAVFLELNQYDQCLRDIELAVKNGYPQHLKPKLVERQLKCETKSNLERDIMKTEYTEVKEYCDTKLFRLSSPNPKIPSAEDFISISIHKERGRELITTRAVPPGKHEFLTY